MKVCGRNADPVKPLGNRCCAKCDAGIVIPLRGYIRKAKEMERYKGFGLIYEFKNNMTMDEWVKIVPNIANAIGGNAYYYGDFVIL